MHQHNKLNCFAHKNNIFHHLIKKETTQGDQQTPTTRRCHHEKTCNIANSANMRNWAKKTIKQSKKSLGKIRQAGKYTYRSKMQRSKQKYQQKITQYGCDHTMQNAEMKQAKNLHHLISHNTIKTVRNKTRKKPEANYLCILKYIRKKAH